jgi:hypothetical protein
MGTFTGIDAGLNFSKYAPGNECYADKTITYCYNAARNSTYNARAKTAYPLTGEYAEYARAEFTEFVLQNAQDGIKNAAVALKFRNFLEYWLGKIDAALISSYLSTGRSWSDRSLFQFQVPEMWCGQVEVDLGVIANEPDRSVQDAIKHASVVFQNVPSVMAFINSQGSFKATKVKVSENAKERADQIAAVKKLRDGLEKALDLPGKAFGLIPYVIGGFILFQLLRMGKK